MLFEFTYFIESMFDTMGFSGGFHFLYPIPVVCDFDLEVMPELERALSRVELARVPIFEYQTEERTVCRAQKIDPWVHADFHIVRYEGRHSIFQIAAGSKVARWQVRFNPLFKVLLDFVREG